MNLQDILKALGLSTSSSNYGGFSYGGEEYPLGKPTIVDGAPRSYGGETVLPGLETGAPRSYAGQPVRFSSPQTGDVLGVDTQMEDGGGYTGGGGSAPSVQSQGGESEADIARRMLESRLNTIKARIAELVSMGNRQKEEAGRVRDQIVGNIGTRFGGLRTTAKTNKENVDASLAEADRGTVRDYAINQGSLNKSTQGAEAKNRALARALGYGNSSYYQNAQQNLNNQLLDRTAKATNERTAKLSDIKRDVSNNETWFNQKNTELDAEEASLKSAADAEYQKQIGDISFAERNYGIENLGEAEQAQADYESRLGAISKYIQAKRDNISSGSSGYADADSKVASIGSGLGQYVTDASQRLSQIMGNNEGLNSLLTPAQSTIASGGEGGYTQTGTQALMEKKKKKTNPYDEWAYGGMNYGRA